MPRLMLALLALAVVPAYSTSITTYSSRTTWLTAASGLQTIAFEGQSSAAVFYNTAAGLTLLGVNFTGNTSTGGYWLETEDPTTQSWYDFGTHDALLLQMDRPSAGATLPYFHIVLPAAITAFGIDLASASPNGLSYSITLAGNTYTAPTFTRPTLGFFGVTSDTPITTIDLTLPGSVFNGGTYAWLDNFTFGAADTQTPEVATFLLIGSGLIGLVALRKRLNRRRSKKLGSSVLICG